MNSLGLVPTFSVCLYGGEGEDGKERRAEELECAGGNLCSHLLRKAVLTALHFKQHSPSKKLKGVLCAFPVCTQLSFTGGQEIIFSTFS